MARHGVAVGSPLPTGGRRPRAGPAGPPLPVVSCTGVPITACDPGVAARVVCAQAAGPSVSGVDVHLCNAYTLALADRDPALHSLLRRAALNLPDGKAVVWANQLTHRDRRLTADRVYGPDLFRAVFRLGQPLRLRHYLLGCTEPVLAALQERLHADYPDALVVGLDSPPFRPLSDPERRAQTDRIRRSGAQLVWVGLGTPKQDWEAARLAAELPVVAVAVGAAFELVAGTKRQAPLWMQRNGLEWGFRLAQEPRRLWRRYLFGNARFLAAVLRAHRRRVAAVTPDRRAAGPDG